MKTLEEPVIRIKTVQTFLGGCTQNLLCWVCSENYAIYNMYPFWNFAPCWECQKDLEPYNLSKWRKLLFYIKHL